MHLKSITIKGFKSFPDRTRLQFGEGVSVIVGPNGSGKSNITDAVLWALGEQSPCAVRGQTMQDVIFSGGRGVQARSEAEVELVLDNGDGTVATGTSELSILRRLDRAGEGEYRLNGARCRLSDVLELLSDTGLGKEAHSVISQGRVEAIVTSKPRDRRLLIEEAAGLGKHRKRRRRAQLKLERTELNLGRALDVEREARARLRPLKRQAEAAELHERLERQLLETRWTVLRDELRARRELLAARAAGAAAARADRDEIQGELARVAAQREEAEQALAQRAERHDEIARRAFAARSARERVAMRLERAHALVQTLSARAPAPRGGAGGPARGRGRRGGRRHAGGSRSSTPSSQRSTSAARSRSRASSRRSRRSGSRPRRPSGRSRRLERRPRRKAAPARRRWRRRARPREKPSGGSSQARRDAARVGAELAATASSCAATPPPSGGAGALESGLAVEPGYELAVAAVLGRAPGRGARRGPRRGRAR